MVQWWRDWRAFKILPVEGRDLASQPVYVYQTISICERELKRVERELSEKPPAKE